MYELGNVFVIEMMDETKSMATYVIHKDAFEKGELALGSFTRGELFDKKKDSENIISINHSGGSKYFERLDEKIKKMNSREEKEEKHEEVEKQSETPKEQDEEVEEQSETPEEQHEDIVEQDEATEEQDKEVDEQVETQEDQHEETVTKQTEEAEESKTQTIDSQKEEDNSVAGKYERRRIELLKSMAKTIDGRILNIEGQISEQNTKIDELETRCQEIYDAIDEEAELEEETDISKLMERFEIASNSEKLIEEIRTEEENIKKLKEELEKAKNGKKQILAELNKYAAEGRDDVEEEKDGKKDTKGDEEIG